MAHRNPAVVCTFQGSGAGTQEAGMCGHWTQCLFCPFNPTGSLGLRSTKLREFLFFFIPCNTSFTLKKCFCYLDKNISRHFLKRINKQNKPITPMIKIQAFNQKFKFGSQAWWLIPLIPALQEAQVGGVPWVCGQTGLQSENLNKQKLKIWESLYHYPWALECLNI